MKHTKKLRRASILLVSLLLFSLFSLQAGAATKERPVLLVGGIPFGVRFFTDGVLVVGYCDVTSNGGSSNPAREAGLLAGDCITGINGTALKSAEQLSKIIQENGNKPLTVSLRREGREERVTLSPLPCDEDGRLRLGLFVRDSGAGIGTVTFLTRENAFGGLGHGICDGESGAIIPLSRGSVMGVTVGGVVRGAVGAPGELRGHFTAGKIGSLLTNTPCGVYGVLAERPALPAGEMPIAFRDEVKEGAATVWCTLDDNVTREYTACLSSIHRGATGNKCFTVTITDKALLDRSGGIVQGMSGSPIVQDGHLVGAVTHVLINDPTTGYGIFIENMLESMSVTKAS